MAVSSTQRRARAAIRLVTVALGGALLVPGEAEAHAFGARYDLPLPLWLYLLAAGAAVTLSFAILAVLVRAPAVARTAPAQIEARPGVWLTSLRAAAVALLALVLAAAFAGDESPTRNFATVFVWVIWWVGLALAQALVVDVWTAANPARSVVAWVMRLPGAGAADPRVLDYWPAVAGFVLFAWLELVSDLGEHPATLGALILGYLLLTLLAGWRFGVDAWFARADPFAAVFGILGRMAPLVVQPARCRLRAPGAGLLGREPVSLAHGVLVLSLLATVTFDGLRETEAWAGALEWITAAETLRAPLLALQGRGMDLLALVETLGLAASIAVFAGAYALFALLVDRASGRPVGVATVAGRFVLTLVPIAVAYHLAHYLSYLLIAGQLVIPLASDPLGRGWDLLGTAGYRVDIAIVDARFVWFTAVGSIVAGHVLAVWLAHVTALDLYRERRAALLSQLPMLVLMVGYTMSSLWILSQPVVM